MASLLLAFFTSAEEAGESLGVVISSDIGTAFTSAGVSGNGIDLETLTRIRQALTSSTDTSETPCRRIRRLRIQRRIYRGFRKDTIGFKAMDADL